ncbi:response regulator [bacterium]|nr:response regulator [bacterium]
MNTRSKILICDPSPKSEMMLLTILESNDYEVEKAMDGHEVLDKAKSLNYDLVLVASDMSGIDGFQVCRLLKESERTRHIPAMLLSELPDQAARTNAIEAGADEYIPKPFNRVELLTRVVTLLRIKHLHDRLERLIEEKEAEKKKLAEKNHELKILSEIARIVISIKDQRKVLTEILNNIRDAFKVYGCCLVIHKDGEWILDTCSSNMNQEQFIQTILPARPVYDFVSHSEKSIIINSTKEDDRFPDACTVLNQMNVFTVLCSPVFIRGRLIGVLQVYNKTDKSEFTSNDLAVLMTLCGQVALAIENLQLFNKLSDFNKNLQEQIAAATHALVDLKNFNESILQNISSGLITTDISGKILFTNHACTTILEYSESDLLDRHMNDIFGNESAAAMMKPVFDQDNMPVSAESRVMTKNKRDIYLGFTTTVRYDADHRMLGYIVSLRDITQIREMRQTIMRMDRLASSGVLTSAIAHEIRNPLAGIKTMAQALEKEMKADDHRMEYVQRIIKQINRLNELLKAFFTYARPVRPEKKQCDFRLIVKEIKELIKGRCETEKISIVELYDPFLPNVFIDENQIQQVMINLMVNALDAMGKGGKLTIEALLTRRSLPPKFHDERDVIEIRVSDTGKGVPREQLKSIFDAFYTTKPNGIGLGLSIVYRIVEEHGGEILVESVEKKGTTFTVLLPLHETVESVPVVDSVM